MDFWNGPFLEGLLVPDEEKLLLISAGKPACITGSDPPISMPTKSPPAPRWSEGKSVAAAALAATVAGEFIRGGEAAEFDRLGHGFFDGPLQIVHFFLRVEEVRGDGDFREKQSHRTFSPGPDSLARQKNEAAIPFCHSLYGPERIR